jgi:uncharacterized membrane protein
VTARVSRFLAGGSLGALILLCLAWELWLAPLRPGGSWMALKALPLLFPVRGVLRGTIYTFQWTLLLVPAYFAEGVVRAWSERAPPAVLACLEMIFALVFFMSAIHYVRMSRRDH